MIGRLLARLVILGLLFAVLGLGVGLVGKYVLDMEQFENPFWAVAAGFVLGAIIGILVSARIESARRSKSSKRR